MRRQPRASIVLPEPGGPDEQQVVPARRRDLERAPRDLLAAHVRQIESADGRAARRACGASASAPGWALSARRSAARPARRGRAARARRSPRPSPPRPRCRGHDDAPDPPRPRPRRDRQHAAHRPQRAVERQLADEQRVRDRVRADHLRRAQQADRDRQVERRAVLAQVGGREVDGDPARRQLEAAVVAARPGRARASRARRRRPARRCRSRAARCRRRPRRRSARLRSRRRQRRRRARTCGGTSRTRCQFQPAFRAVHRATPRPAPGRPSPPWSRRRHSARLCDRAGEPIDEYRGRPTLTVPMLPSGSGPAPCS